MSHTILIPKVGVVAFPPEMKPSDINDAVRTLHHKAVIKSVLKFVSKDPALVGLDVAEFYKQLGVVAAFLEKYPSLSRAADAGIHGEKVHDLPTVEQENEGPVEQSEQEPEESTEQPREETPAPQNDAPQAEAASKQSV
jgi:hypothetical protein